MIYDLSVIICNQFLIACRRLPLEPESKNDVLINAINFLFGPLHAFLGTCAKSSFVSLGS